MNGPLNFMPGFFFGTSPGDMGTTTTTTGGLTFLPGQLWSDIDFGNVTTPAKAVQYLPGEFFTSIDGWVPIFLGSV